MLVYVDLKEGKFEKFMGWMQSDEGMTVRKSAAYPEKTIASVTPDKGGIMFKVHVHNVDVMKQLISRYQLFHYINIMNVYFKHYSTFIRCN